jgi:DNA-binding CsgD family transcriptional regulator
MQLSSRQRQILSLLALGKSNKEVAYELSITEGTVKQHLSVIFKKLQVTNRAKAVIAATEFLANERQLNIKHPTSLLSVDLPSNFVWRLISAVAIYFKPNSIKTPTEKAQFNQTMSDMHQFAKTLVEALDGILTIVPGIGMIASFGAPKSHLDDAARAIFIAHQIQQWSLVHNELPMSIGIATAAEVLADQTNTIYRAESFSMAADIAFHAKPLQIFANEITCRLAGPVAKYSSPIENLVKDISIREIYIDEPINHKQLAGKSPLPFMPEIIKNLQVKNAQWVNVEGWPPYNSVRLQDAIASHLQALGINTYKLRLPNDQSTEDIGRSAYTQLNIQARIRQRPDGNEMFLSTSESNAKRLLASIKILTMRGSLAIIFYGINTLESFKKVIGENGQRELENYPVILVTSELHISDESHITAKILGSNPLNIASITSFKLPIGKTKIDLEVVNIDLATLLDSLSTNAKQIIRYITLKSPVKTSEVGKFQGEVLSTGLFLINENSEIECRDETTLKSLKALYLKP